MPLYIENKGEGFIGEIGEGWKVQQNTSPMILGQPVGRLGSLSFRARCDSTSKFTIDNYLSVKHYFDDQTTRWLATFDIHVRSVDTDNNFGSFSGTSILSTLDVIRTSSVNASGTYQRGIELPVGEEYVISSTTYYTGGSYQMLGGVNTFVPTPIIIYDIACEDDYAYVLASGGHNGEVVFMMGLDGLLFNVFPVYSDATDTSNPGSRYITYADGNLWIAQVNADRVKRFDTDGTFVSQWGSAGSADGQFGTISGIVSNDTGFNAVYVVDSALGRVQCFQDDGTFSFKWGTSGTGSGNTVFNAPNSISIDPKTNQVFVGDRNARVRVYSSGGGYVAQAMGTYDFASNTSMGEFLAGDYPIRTTFDSRGNAYAVQNGVVYKYVRDNGGWATSMGKPVQEWDTRGINDTTRPTHIASNRGCGVLWIPRDQDVVEQWSGSLGNLQAYITYYIALAAEDFTIRLLAMNDDFAADQRAHPAWTGNVWAQLCDLLAASNNAALVMDDRLMFVNRTSRYVPLPEQELNISPVNINSRAAGRSIEIINYNSRWSAGQEVMYSAMADDRRIFSLAVNSLAYAQVRQDTYPEYLIQPTAHTSVANGRYTVIDRDGALVNPTTWANYGGAIRAVPMERPGVIQLTLVGPGLDIPNHPAPYRIATTGNEPSLSIMGSGVITKPETLRIGTGASEAITSREVAQSIDSAFVQNSSIAYSEGAWAAYTAGSPEQRVRITMRTDRSPKYDTVGGINGTALLVGAIVTHDEAQYMIESVEYGAMEITMEGYRYTQYGYGPGGENSDARPLEIWGGKTAGEFGAFWSGFTAEDFKIAPLHNPYGV